MRAVVLCAAMLALSACSDEAPGDEVRTVDLPGDPGDPPPPAPPPFEGAFGEKRNVRVGLSGPELDACAGYGVVTGVPEDGQPVLAAPSRDASEIDRLANERGVAICEMAGGWIGVVYPQDAESEVDCETGSPVESEQDYSGPCRSGWIRDGAVEFVAG